MENTQCIALFGYLLPFYSDAKPSTKDLRGKLDLIGVFIDICR